ncbi:brevican core protein-like [Pholidichthys leucotaenia]
MSAPLGSSISIPCLSVSSVSMSSSSSPIVPRVKWSVVSGGVETQILVARGHRVKINDAYQDRAALLNYTTSPDDLSLWLGDLRSSDSGHYRCEVQQGLDDASDLVQLKIKGVVFHYRDALGRYAFTFQHAQSACKAIGAQIATADQLLAAYYDGYEQCDAGWLADQSVRYPIQMPREGCYGDMDGQPGVRNYGTMDQEDLFDVYCYAEQMEGEVFHDSIPQQLTFDEAQSFCIAAGAELATTAQLYLAWSEGLDRCNPGWLADGSVRYPINSPRERCGGNQAGVKTLYRFANQTGFPEPSSLHDVYCFRGNRSASSASSMDYIITGAEDIEQNVLLLMENDQELHLNQQSEQMEHEAQSLLESLPFFSAPFTEENLVGTQSTITSDPTESPLNTTSAEDLVRPFGKTSSPTEMSYDSELPTELFNSTISSTETYNSPQTTSFLPSVYNETDSHQNSGFTFFQSQLERATHEPQTENQTGPDTNPGESTQPSNEPDQTKEEQHTNLNVNGSQVNQSETDNSHSQEDSFWEVITLTPDPIFQVTFEEATVKDPELMTPTTQSTKEKGAFPSQSPQTTKSTIEAMTSLLDGSGDVSQENDTEVGGISFTSTSDASSFGLTTYSSPTATASSSPTETNTAILGISTSSSSLHHLDRLGLDALSTLPQLWESRQEGSTSIEIKDTSLTIESEDKDQLLPPTSEVLLVSEMRLEAASSPKGSDISYSPTISAARYQTPGYGVFLDTVASAYEEASGYEPVTITSTHPEENKVASSFEDEIKVSTAFEQETSYSLSQEKQATVAPMVDMKVSSTLSEEGNVEEETNVNTTLIVEEMGNVTLTLQRQANDTTLLEEEVKVTPTQEQVNVSPTLEENINVLPTLALEEEGNATPIFEAENFATTLTSEEEAVYTTLYFEEEAKVSSTDQTEASGSLLFEDKANVGSTVALEEDANVFPTLEFEEEANSFSSFEEQANLTPIPVFEIETNAPVLDTEANVTPVLDEEANVASTLEEKANFPPTPEEKEDIETITPTDFLELETDVSSTLEDFTIVPLNSQTSKWGMLTTTSRPQESQNDLEYSRKTSSTSASSSSQSTKSTSSPKAKVTATTHWSWSPTTSSKVHYVTAEPQKVTHVLPPMDHGLVGVELSLTQPPTLLIFPNERAAVGGAGKSSDACADDPCLNGGTCTDRFGQTKCLCLPSYGGDFCQTDLEQCEPGWDKFHGFCYKHFSLRKSWEVAEQHCRTMGAHLVSIMTPEEQTYINSNYQEYQWTGLNDKTIEDDFRWSDGSPLLYENWYRGQPDSYFLSGEDCVVMVWHDNGRWSDVPCNYHLAYTCKKGTSSCGPPPKVRNASIFGKLRQRYETNAVVRYHCADGFLQRLNPLVRCLPEGSWERPKILCTPESGHLMLYPEGISATDINFAAAEDDFEATTESPQYWDIKF